MTPGQAGGKGERTRGSQAQSQRHGGGGADSEGEGKRGERKRERERGRRSESKRERGQLAERVVSKLPTVLKVPEAKAAVSERRGRGSRCQGISISRSMPTYFRASAWLYL